MATANWRGLLFGGGTGFAVAQNSLGERPVMCFRPDFENLGFPDVVDPLYGQLPSPWRPITRNDSAPVLKKFLLPETTTFGSKRSSQRRTHSAESGRKAASRGRRGYFS